MGSHVQEGKGIRDNLLGVTTARRLVYNDQACRLESVICNASVVGGTQSVTVLTSDNTNVADGDTVTIGAITYRFKTTPVQAYDVQRDGSTADTSLTHLGLAINGTGVPGTDYFAGTLAHPWVSSSTVSAHSLTITALNGGTDSNSLATTETSAHLSFTGTTMGGGTVLGVDFKMTLGYCLNGVAPSAAISVTAAGGEIVLSNAPNRDRALGILLNTAQIPECVLPAGSWLVVKSISGSASAITGAAMNIVRRRLTGTH